MAFQSAIATTLAYKAETTFNTLPGASGAKYLRSVSSTLGLAKDTYTSNERRSDQQVVTSAHGTRRGGGSIEGEFSLTSYDAFLANLMRNTWTAGASGSVSVTIDNTAKTITRASGSWVSDGYKPLDVIRLTTGAPSLTQNINHIVVSVTSTVLTLLSEPGDDLGVAGSVTIAVVGNKLLNGTAEPSMCIEQYYPTLDASERFLGCVVGGGRLALPASGLMTCGFDIDAMDSALLSGSSSPYFTSITAADTTDVFAAVNGVLLLDGAAVGTVTGLDFQFSTNVSGDPCVGQNTRATLFRGTSTVNGNMNVLMDSTTMLQAFYDETEMSLLAMVTLPAVGSAAPEFFTIRAGRIKFSGASKTIGNQGGIPLSMPFQALKDTASGHDASTVVLQSSL